MGGWILAAAPARVRAAVAPALRVALLILLAVALTLAVPAPPASAEPGLAPPACPPDRTLQAIERGPGGVILTGRATSADPVLGRVGIAVESWYHRGAVRGLNPGDRPASVEVDLGPSLSGAGAPGLAHVPPIGSRWIVAGSWPDARQGIVVACGVFADLSTAAGSAWLASAELAHTAMHPSTADPGSGNPRDDYVLVIGGAIGGLLVAAALLAAIADARNPPS